MKKLISSYFCLIKHHARLLIALLICLVNASNVLCAGSSILAELTSGLATLANINQNLQPAQNGNHEPAYFSDPDFFSNLLTKTSNIELKNKLKNNIQKLEQLSAKQQKLAKYLLHFLFENKQFSSQYKSGGLYPNFNYTVEPSYLFADGTTDLITRILLVLTIVNDIEQNWTPKEEIGIASLAAGYLLQDFILIKALYFSGYNKIRLSIIDPKNHTKDLEEIIKKDSGFDNLSIKIKHYQSTYQFISNVNDSDRMAINVCYIVSPTSLNPSKMEAFALLNDPEINVVRIGKVPKESISFYIPQDGNDSFAKADVNVDPDFVKGFLTAINKSLEKQNDFSTTILKKVFGYLPGLYINDLYGSDDIMLDFYDIIKNSGISNCLGYIAFEDSITRYPNIKEQPYWTLNYRISGSDEHAIIWTFDPTKKHFEQL